MADDIKVLNEYGLASRTRLGKSKAGNTTRGKTRYTITMSSEPLLIQTDPKALGKQVADAMCEALKTDTRNISATAAPATIKARQSALKGVVQGQPWAMKRYSGGRTGTRVPNQSDRLFNDSGRLIESIRVGATSQGWVINVAANRFDPNTLNGGESALVRIVDRLRELVPIWDAARMKDDLRFAKALRDTTKDMLRKANERTVELQKQLMQQAWGAVLRLIA